MPVKPEAGMPASSHSLGPAAVLAVAAELYDKRPEARILAIRGHSFALGEGLTERAEKDLGAALEFLVSFLKEDRA
ncbi:MAG: hypothetical protein JW775_03980 [Candidatus Aminicenantes bacterium]|nr:hypothetical protein [Candidatus Aminicenantes bacterium]